MRGAFVIAVATAVLAASILGLVEDKGRSGPFDETLASVVTHATATGTYHARPAGGTVQGLCLAPPCQARAAIDLRLAGLPSGPYEAQLAGTTTTQVGPVVEDAAGHVLRWSEDADHSDKHRLILLLAGRQVMSIPVRATPDPISLDGPVAATWTGSTGEARLAEIGGFTVSTIAAVRLDEVAPAGWVFQAFLEGTDGATHLGMLESTDGRSELDGRVERMRLERQHRLVVVLQPEHATPSEAGFPILHGVIAAALQS